MFSAKEAPEISSLPQIAAVFRRPLALAAAKFGPAPDAVQPSSTDVGGATAMVGSPVGASAGVGALATLHDAALAGS
jgi:hypothetical protein